VLIVEIFGWILDLEFKNLRFDYLNFNWC